MLRWAAGLLLVIALFAGAVLYALHLPAKPLGYGGLQLSPLTAAAAARTPLLPRGGALVAAVEDKSPAARAGIKAGEVLAAIDGAPVVSARQAARLLRARAGGDRVALSLYDITEGEIRPRAVTLTFDAAPPVTAMFSVRPPRVLAKEFFFPPGMAANAAWSKSIARGAFIRPREMTGIGDGHCNGFVPQDQVWETRGHAPDDSMYHVAAHDGFAHAMFQSARLGALTPPAYIAALLEKTFGSPVLMTPRQALAYGFTLINFGNRRGASGFAVYRVRDGRIALWLAAVPGADMAWARPLVGAVALSLHCDAPGAPPLEGRDPALAAVSISTRCQAGVCGESDFAGAYLETLKLGYVHSPAGRMFLVNPRRDLWRSGAQGPGFYHQVSGRNEKLEPGRTN